MCLILRVCVIVVSFRSLTAVHQGAVAQAIALTLVGYFPIFAVAVGYGIACFVVCFLFLVPMIRHWGEHPPQALEMDAA